MRLEKIINKLEEHVAEVYEDAYQTGYTDGRDDNWDEGFDEGVRTERNRIISMFEMLSAMNMENGSATKAKQYYEAAQLVKVANEMEKHDWSEEGIAKAYQEELEKDGF